MFAPSQQRPAPVEVQRGLTNLRRGTLTKPRCLGEPVKEPRRSTYQLATQANEAPFPNSLSAVAAVVYVAATLGLARRAGAG
jgi:hypothetical protein